MALPSTGRTNYLPLQKGGSAGSGKEDEPRRRRSAPLSSGYTGRDEARRLPPGRCTDKADTTDEPGLTFQSGNDQSPLGKLLAAFRAELRAGGGSSMLTLGLMLLLLGYLTDIGILVTLGIILLVVGAVLWILGSMGARSALAPRWLMRRSWKDIVAVGGHLPSAGEDLRRSLLTRCPNS
jgi:hypothetical protein